MIGVKALGAPHVLTLVVGVSRDMLPVKYFCSDRFLFVSVEFCGDMSSAAPCVSSGCGVRALMS